MSGFDVAAGVVGMVSLGLQCCKGIATFYGSYKDYGPKMERLLESTKNCRTTLELISSITINHGSLNPSACQGIEDCIISCIDALEIVEVRVKKLKSSEKPWKYGSSMQKVFDKSVYCFKESTILGLAQDLDSAKDDVTRALGILGYFKLDKLEEELQNGFDGLQRQLTGVSMNVGDVSVAISRFSSQIGSMDNTIQILPAQLDMIKKSVVEEIREGRKVAEEIPIETILDWISTMKFEERQNHVLKDLHKGTCKWFFEHPTFHKWRDGRAEELWCVGIPGGGKTILTAAIIQHIRNFVSSGDIGICFIYFNHQNQKEQALLHVLSSLLRQVVKSISPFPDNIRQKYLKHKVNEQSLDSEEIIALLKSLLSTLSKTFIIIDALDECNEEFRGDLLDHLRGLSLSVNILATSRDLPDIRDAFQGCPEISIFASDSDMRLYLADTIKGARGLSRLAAKNSELSSRIIDTICEKAGGMFLYAKLNIQSVTKSMNLARVNRALSKMPEDLETTYDREMQRIRVDNDSQDIAMKVLAWIIFATENRPFTLYELQHAVAIQEYTEFQEQSEEEPYEDFVSPDPLFLLKSCHGFLVLDEEAQTVMWAHYTTREYFNNGKRQSNMFPSVYFELTKACLSYLSLDCFANAFEPEMTPDILIDHIRRYPFYLFAAKEWGNLARKIPEVDHEDSDEMIIRFLDNELISRPVSRVWRLPSYFRRANGTKDEEEMVYWLDTYLDEYDNPSNGFSIASRLGLTSTVSAMLKKGKSPNVPDESGNVPIISAIQSQNLATLELLLACDADINMGTTTDGITPLIYSVENRWLGDAVLETLLQHPLLDLNKTNRWGSSALMYATNDLDIFKRLLKNGADPNILDTQGHTALMHLSDYGEHQSPDMETLLKYGIDIDTTNNIGRTALSYAARAGREDLVQLLLEMTSEPHLQDSRGMNVAMHASSSSSDSADKVLSAILQSGAIDPKVTDFDGRNLLIIAAESYLCLKKFELLLPLFQDLNQQDNRGQTVITKLAIGQPCDSVPALKKLLGNPSVNVNIPDKTGRTPLSWAVSSKEEVVLPCNPQTGKRSQTVIILIKKGADLNTRCQNGRTLLSYAAGSKSENTFVFQILLGHRADSRTTICKSGRTPLSYAAEKGHIQIAEILLSYPDSAPFLPDIEGNTPLDYAAMFRRTSMVELLLKYAADEETAMANATLCQASLHGSIYVMKSLLERYDIDLSCCSRNSTPLLCAAKSGVLEGVKLLVEKGASLETKTENGQTVLYVAASRNHLEIVDYLLSIPGVKNQVNIQDGSGWTPLLKAVVYGYLSMVECLLNNGADTEYMNENGQNAILIAASKGLEDIFAVLVKHGADLNSRDDELKCPLMLAAKNGCLKMIATLIEKYGLDPLNRNMDGSTPLFEAVENSASKEVVELLLKFGADPDDENENGLTPLTIAVALGNEEITKVLIGASKHGLGYKNKFDRSVLSICAQLGLLAGVKLLIKLGCDINEKDQNGRSPLSWAVQSNPEFCIEIVDFIIAQEGIELESHDNNGFTPLDWLFIPGTYFVDEWAADTENTKEKLVGLLETALETKTMKQSRTSEGRYPVRVFSTREAEGKRSHAEDFPQVPITELNGEGNKMLELC